MTEGASRSRLHLRPATSPSCLYCKQTFVEAEPIFACEGCGVGYHRDCMRDELGRCATLGCDGRRAMPQRAKAPLDPVHRRRLEQAFGACPGAVFAPLPAHLDGALRRRLARGVTADETLLLALCDPESGVPLAAFTDQAAYLDFSGGQQARRLVLADLRVEHRHGWLNVTPQGGSPRLISLGAFAGELRRYLLALCGEAWTPGLGFACDRCLADFGSRQTFVECLACGACVHPDCAQAGACPGQGCGGDGELVKRRTGAYLLDGSASSASDGCGACAQGLSAGDATLACEGCQAVYHAQCLRAFGHCATRRCRGRRALPGRQPFPWGTWLAAAAALALVFAMVASLS